jgi:hypothetical protein
MSSSLFVKIFHIALVGALFFYDGIKRTEIPKWMFPALIALGTIIIFYHGYKLYNHIQHKESYWINLVHLFYVGPLLVFIGYCGEETKRKYFEMLLMLGFAVVGYHGYYLVQDFTAKT